MTERYSLCGWLRRSSRSRVPPKLFGVGGLPMIELHVTGPRVLVQVEDQGEYQRQDGLITVQAYDPGVIGTVLSCGPQVRDVKPGDVVLFPPSAGQELEFDGDHLLIFDEQELIAKWDSEQKPI